MRNFFNRVFNVRPEEFSLFALLSLLLLGNTVARQMTGIIGISDLIYTGGVNQTLLVNGINGVLIFITAMLASMIVDRFNRVELLKWTTFTFALLFVCVEVISLLNTSGKVVAALVYLMSQQQWLLFPMFFWVLSTDIFEIAQSKRLIPAIGSWSFVGKVIGILLTLLPSLLYPLGWISARALSIDLVIRFNILFYLLAFLLVTGGLSKVQLRPVAKTQETVKETLTEGLDFVRDVPSFRFLLLAIIAVAVCDVILEYRFFVVAKAAYPDAAGYKQFYSLYLLAAGILSFSIQGFVTSRIVQRFQLKNTFLIQPFLALGTTLAMILSPEVISTTISSLFLKVGRNTVDESTRKAFQGFVPEERRGRVALFTDNYAPAIGMVMAAIMAGLIILVCETYNIVNSFYIYLGVSGLVAAIAVWSIMRMRAVYDNSLFNWRLKRRKRGVEVLKKLEF